MSPRIAPVSGALAGLALLLVIAAALAGPLNPPAGPVGSTYKTLAEVEPRIPIGPQTTPGDADSVYRIEQPGSYYLVGNLAGEDGKAGIEIATSGVSIDLRGFDVTGSAASLDAIRTDIANIVNVAITNGSILAWGGDGIDLATEPAVSCRVEGVSVGHCGRNGMLLGSGTVVERCTARANGTSGVSGLSGIRTGSGCTVRACTALENNGNGILAGPGSVVADCTAHTNASHGIRVAAGSTVSACSAHSNSGVGIAAPPGVPEGSGSTIINCTAHSNASAGIQAFSGCTITGCTVRNNPTGIICSGRCIVRHNTCTANTGAGIIAGDTENVVDGNTCIDNAKGIEVTFAGSIIIRNSCAGNTTANWVIAPNNRLGPIVLCQVNTTQITTSAAAPGTLTSADPYANFSY